MKSYTRIFFNIAFVLSYIIGSYFIVFDTTAYHSAAPNISIKLSTIKTKNHTHAEHDEDCIFNIASRNSQNINSLVVPLLYIGRVHERLQLLSTQTLYHPILLYLLAPKNSPPRYI